MKSISSRQLTDYCDRALRTAEIQDYEGAVNGLQVDNDGRVHKLAAAVDASPATVRMAIEAGADLLLVHHGLFWGGGQPWTGARYRLLRALIEGNLAVYSVHLPLDCHPRLGNNAGLCDALGFRNRKPFFFEKGRFLGLRTLQDLPWKALAARLARAVGRDPLVLPCGPARCRRIGVVTGGAGGELKQAAREGIDTFITGEGPHWTFPLAQELGVNVFYAGHYATETFGVKALAARLSRRFGLPWVFLDDPSGL